jgi:hypothetical protein
MKRSPCPCLVTLYVLAVLVIVYALLQPNRRLPDPQQTWTNGWLFVTTDTNRWRGYEWPEVAAFMWDVTDMSGKRLATVFTPTSASLYIDGKLWTNYVLESHTIRKLKD